MPEKSLVLESLVEFWSKFLKIKFHEENVSMTIKTHFVHLWYYLNR